VRARIVDMVGLYYLLIPAEGWLLVGGQVVGEVAAAALSDVVVVLTFAG
jgi:hypothetical protein